MALIEMEQYSFTYAGADAAALERISLTVEAGQLVLLCGATGSGKSTLLGQLKPMVMPQGTASGTLRYAESPLTQLSPSRQAQEIGLVMQNVDNQMVMELVWQELAFPLENLGLPQAEMRARVAELASAFGLTPLLEQRMADLSGGQRQLINLASVLIMRPQLLLLDEPLAQLDPVMSRQFLQVLTTLQEEMGLTIIIAEHHLDELLPLAERVVVLEAGTVASDGTAGAACRYFAERPMLGDYVPQLARLYWQVEGALCGEPPLTVRQGKDWAARYSWQKAAKAKPAAVVGEVALAGRDLYFRYERHGSDVLRALDITVHEGELLAVVGGNGSGKSTLLKALFGALTPQRGSVRLHGRRLQDYQTAQLAGQMGYLAQNPEAYFLCDTVALELARRKRQLGARLDAEAFDRLARLFALDEVLERHPYDLSGGQKQRLALFLVTCANPHVLLLDEPTRGLDPSGKRALAETLMTLCAQKMAVVMVTHDLEFAAAWAHSCGLIFQGELSELLPTAQFFAGKHFYTTVLNKVLGGWLPEAIRADDVQAVRHE